MRKIFPIIFSSLVAFFLIGLLVLPTFAEESNIPPEIKNFVPSDPKTAVKRDYKRVTLGQKPTKPGEPRPLYDLNGLGTGETWLNQYGGCSGHEGSGHTATFVNDNSNYNPEADGTFSVNSVQQDSRSNNEELNFNEASWDTSHKCYGASVNWRQNSTHKIWNTTLFTHTLSDNESFYSTATF